MTRKTSTLPQRELLYRLGPSLAAGALYLVFVTLWLHARALYYPFQQYADDMLNQHPYGDLDSLMRIASCWRQGVNVYAPSACMHGGVYNYSPFMLRAARLPIGPWDTTRFGLIIGALFIAALALLPPATSRAEFGLRVLTVCSSSVVFVLETGNFDGIMFMLVLIGVLLLNTRASVLGYPVFLFAAACKFYPVCLMLLVLRERAAAVLTLAALGAAGLAVFVLLFGHGLAAAMSIIPAGLPFRGVFGALNLSFGLMLLNYLPFMTLEPNVPEFFYAVDHPMAPVLMEAGTHLLTLFGLIASVFSAPRLSGIWRALEPQRATCFLAGAIILVFCFYVTQNLEYRAVFLVLLVPGLWTMSRHDSQLKAMLVCVMVLLWAEFFRHLVFVLGNAFFGPEYAFYPEVIFWLARECMWWWVMIQLGAFITCFVRQNLERLFAEIFPAQAAQNG